MYPVKETLTGHVGLGKLMQTSLQGISQKAKRLKNNRFQNLYRLIDVNALRIAWKQVNKNAAAGIDKITAEEYAKNLKGNIVETVNSLKAKSYRTKLVRRVEIPKGEGKTRPLGIPATSDKIVQGATANILKAIYENDFLDCSYGYRPKVGAENAVKDLTKEIQGKYSYIVEADIKGFFNNINHEWLIKMLEQRVNDKAFTGLIKKWLKAGVMETDGNVIHPVTGTPQGGIISPILANIYLHYVIDLWFEKKVKPECEGESYICRYADDFICAFRYKDDAERFYNALGERLNKFGLELAKEKTNIISFSRFRKHENTYFEFLGFEFRWGKSRKGKDIILRRTSRKKFKKSLQNFKEWCKENRDKRLARLFALLNAKLRGYYNYYGVIGNYESLNKFFYEAKKILYKWLNRRSQRKSFNFREFARAIEYYGMLKPRVTEKRDNQIKLEFI